MHATWLKTSEAIDFAQAIKPARAFGIHNAQVQRTGNPSRQRLVQRVNRKRTAGCSRAKHCDLPRLRSHPSGVCLLVNWTAGALAGKGPGEQERGSGLEIARSRSARPVASNPKGHQSWQQLRISASSTLHLRGPGREREARSGLCAVGTG